MSNLEIIEYIKQQMLAGYSKEQVTSALLTSGWKKEDIDNAFIEVEGGVYEIDKVKEESNLSSYNNSFEKEDVIHEEPKKQDSNIIKVFMLAVALTVVMLFGVMQISNSISILFALVNPYMIPTYILTGIFVFVFLHLFKRIYIKTGKPIRSFLTTLSSYFLTIIGLIVAFTFIVKLYSNTVSGDVVWGLFFVASTLIQLSYFIFYLGSVLLMILMIKFIKKELVPVVESGSASTRISNVMIFTLGLFLIYFLGLVVPVAKITGMQSLCNFVYHKHVKTECLSEDFVNIEGSVFKAESGNFDIIVDDKAIGDIEVVNNKIAYTFAERKMGSTVISVVYDGEVLGKYGYVYKLTNLDGKLAYLVENENGSKSRYTLMYDGEKYADLNKSVYDLIDINGKMAYGVYDMKNPYVYFDDKKYGDSFVLVDSLVAHSGQPAFEGRRDLKSYIVVGDKEYGPYKSVFSLQEKDGYLFALIENNGEVQAFVNGEVYWMGRGYSKGNGEEIGDFIDGKFSTIVNKKGKAIIVFGEQELSEVPTYDSGPYKIDGKLGYMALNSDGSSQFMVDGRVVPKNVFSEPVYNVAVSDLGKIAVKTKDEKGVAKVYIDGEVVFEGGGNLGDVKTGLEFIGEKLLFDIKREDGISTPWYNGAIIGEGFYKFKKTTFMNDKLLLLVSKRDGKNIILLEQ